MKTLNVVLMLMALSLTAQWLLPRHAAGDDAGEINVYEESTYGQDEQAELQEQDENLYGDELRENEEYEERVYDDEERTELYQENDEYLYEEPQDDDNAPLNEEEGIPSEMEVGKYPDDRG